MKIEISRTVPDGCNVSDLSPGECFLWKGDYYIRADHCIHSWPVCVRLSDGHTVSNGIGNDVVIPVEAVVQIQ